MCEFLERRALPSAELRRLARPRDDSHVLVDTLRFVDAPRLVTDRLRQFVAAKALQSGQMTGRRPFRQVLHVIRPIRTPTCGHSLSASMHLTAQCAQPFRLILDNGRYSALFDQARDAIAAIW